MVKLKWNTEISEFKTAELYMLVDEIFKFCRNEIGLIPRNRVYPQLIIRPRKESENCGEYCPTSHLIEIYAAECPNLRWFVDTVIHEFTHSCQRFISVRYQSASQKHGYSKNPFEVEARKIARENRAACIEHLQKIFG